jgi:predicted Zn-dependent protease
MKKTARKICIFLLALGLINMNCLTSAYGFSIGEEREVGEKLLFTVRSTFPLLNDPDIYQYINNLGQEILSEAGPQYFDFRFFVINDKEFNAFSAFSGMIFFYSGLIETMNSENEFVAVMGHEIGHSVKRHLASSIEKGNKISIGTLALALASLAMGGGVATQALLSGSMAANQSLTLHFSRQNENEADLLSYGWMKKLGRNPEAMERMLQTMRRITRYRSGKIPQYLLTHPDPEARLDYVESLLVKDKNILPKLNKGDNFAFLRFKYRIMSQADDGSTFRSYLAEKLADSHSSKLDLVMAKYGLSQLDMEESNFDSSLQEIDEVIKAYPDRKILLDDKGVIQLKAGKTESALLTLTQAYQQNPGDYYAVYSLATVQMSLNNLAEAERLFKIVAGEMPEYAQVYYELGQINANNKKEGNATYYLGSYYYYCGKTKLAKEMLKAASKKKDVDGALKKDALEKIETIDRIEGKKEKEASKEKKN